MNAAARSEILARRLKATRDTTVRLCETLGPEDCAAQSMPDASPAKWHLAHTTWFFETFVLKPDDPDHAPFHPRFEYLFNSYYNAVGEQYSRPDRGLLTRPTWEEVIAYRAHVDRAMTEFLSEPARLASSTLDVVDLGIHHEQQHQELLLTDVKHLLSHNPLDPVFRADPAASDASTPPATPLAWHAFAGGLVEIGHAAATFAFDNESPRHPVHLGPFDLASRPVTAGEFVAFLDDGGYARPEFWLSEGWARKEEEGWEAPLYWAREAAGWSQFTLSGRRPVDPAEPVCHVSLFEADAFARWAGCRLPTEAEWEHAAGTAIVDGNLLESGRLHPAASPSVDVDTGPRQLFGDVWEWTSSAYAAYPGFAPAAGALGEYNGKFMSSQIVLKGGSCASPRSHLRPTYRNFFPPDARWQFSGIRLARDAR